MRKVISLEKLIILRATKLKARKVVLATGVFDILHFEHIHFLKKAKDQGGTLIVGIEPDLRVRKRKGKGRPLHSQVQRAAIVAALEPVDFTFVLPDLSSSQGREKLIGSLKPNIYAISSNTPFKKEKQRVISKFKGKLKVVLQHNAKVSTSKIIASLKKQK